MYADEERKHWKECFERGIKLPMYYLDEYRRNREIPTWRTTRVIERLCEYIIYLEEQLDAHEKSRKVSNQTNPPLWNSLPDYPSQDEG